MFGSSYQKNLFFDKMSGAFPKRRPHRILCLFNYHKKHFEALFAKNRMGMTCGHYNGFTFMKLVMNAVDGDLTYAVKTGDKCVAGCGVRTYFLVFIKGKKGDA